jgi:uncharacterized GH25 family protein
MIARMVGVLFLVGGFVQAHDMELKVEKQPGAVAVRFGYGPQDPAKGAPVTVFSPADAATPFQTGQTDQRGVFVFAPDRAGAWRVVADDGEGHREEARITVGEDGAIQFEDHSHSRANTFVTGVSLLVGVTGIALWWSGRRRPNS